MASLMDKEYQRQLDCRLPYNLSFVAYYVPLVLRASFGI